MGWAASTARKCGKNASGKQKVKGRCGNANAEKDVSMALCAFPVYASTVRKFDCALPLPTRSVANRLFLSLRPKAGGESKLAIGLPSLLILPPEAESRGKRQSGRALLAYQFSCVELPMACGASSANECLSAADWKITGEVLSRRALEWSLCSPRNDCNDLGEEKNKYSRTRSLGIA